MQLSKMKNTIVLKGMASNIVDEAIVVLKPNVKIKQGEFNSKKTYEKWGNDKKVFVVKEAENTINTYIEKLKSDSEKTNTQNLKIKYRFLQISNAVLIISIMIATIIFA